MPIIKFNPPYKHLYQKPAFCGPCCVQMVLFRRGLWVDQEEIALELNTGILKKNVYHYAMPQRIVNGKIKTKIGVSLKSFDTHLNEIFKKYNLALHAKEYNISQVSNPKEFIVKNITEDNDIIVDFWLRQEKPRKIEVGHYVLISKVDTDSNMLTICDPDSDAKNSWKIDINELIDLMNKKWDGNERGFIIIKKLL
ncbi:C39 family peptidase [archaeon]|nr:C39 family peptidase [archaeon]